MQCPGQELRNMLAIMNKQYLSYNVAEVLLVGHFKQDSAISLDSIGDSMIDMII